MTNNKRKKNSRQRGGTTHGWGSMKKHRGAGHRGGRGNAGSGKRGDAKKPSLGWKKGSRPRGKLGFKSHSSKSIRSINLSDIQKSIETFVKRGVAEKKNDVYTLDIKSLKYDKLLGSGKIKSKMEIKADYASESAIAKVEQAGGKVILLEKEKTEKTEKEAAPSKAESEAKKSEKSENKDNAEKKGN